MLAFFSSSRYGFKVEEVTRDIVDDYVSTFVILRFFCFWNIEIKYSRHFMLDFPFSGLILPNILINH